MKNKILFIILVVAALGGLFLIDNPARRFLVALVYQETITPEDLHDSYRERDFKILIVPGHDNYSWGAQFGATKEADLALLIAKKLQALLAANKHFQVVVSRNLDSGEYEPVFSDFFAKEWERIAAFRSEKKSLFKQLLQSGAVASRVIVGHNYAANEASLRLHGLNLWANENDVDLTLHLHVNDYAGRKSSRPGVYQGLAIYVPEKQYPNSRASLALAQSLSDSLKQVLPVSNLPEESGGIIEDQELIAVGSAATRDGAAVLIEYGYIYEPRWGVAEHEETATQLAEQTYNGLINYLKADKVSRK